MELANISYFKISCKNDTKHMKNNNKGFTIIEVLIVAALGLFTLMTAFYAICNILANIILTEKKVELVH